MKADLLWQKNRDTLPFTDVKPWDMYPNTGPIWDEGRRGGRYISPYADSPLLPRRRRPQLPPELEPPDYDEPLVACIKCGMTVPGGFTYNGLCGPCEVVRFKKLGGGMPPDGIPYPPSRPVEIPTPSPAKPEVQPSPLGSKGKRVFSDD